LPGVVTNRHIFNQYVIRVPHRDRLQAALHKRGVATEVYYPIPMHLQECFAYLGHGVGAFPESERAAKETLALPISPELSEAQLRYVVDSIADFVAMNPLTEGTISQTTSEPVGPRSRR
jgi:dTDP-4-amino-4,6-dideoxygalactose transaminase